MNDIAEFAERLAPVVDELVYSVHRQARADSGDDFRSQIQSLGVENHGLAGIAPELLDTVGISRAAFERRFRYASEDSRRSFLEEFGGKGLVVETDERLVASPAMRGYLTRLEEARAQAAAAIWDAEAAAEVNGTIRAVLRAAPLDFQVTADVAANPEGDSPQHQLFNLLTKLRYVRADAHFAAWSDHGMTAPEMVQLTTRWRGQTPREDPETIASLTERGLIREDQLTAEGITFREMIEEDTNLHNGRALQALSEAERGKLLSQLEALPTVPA